MSLDSHLLEARTHVRDHYKQHCVNLIMMSPAERNNRTGQHFKGLRMSAQLTVCGRFSGQNSRPAFPSAPIDWLGTLSLAESFVALFLLQGPCNGILCPIRTE
ncbi:hypothetical protein ElyMa_005912100 [Elysia marginata]|uniref:Uncharacterized protein n=1 Tax=Elysia marginata TaxID=1093978 RepID=A0AAV4G6Y4_9GAST|nr:hypothetical protein ElyMa_005912100 [Elysia marginata]